MLPVRKQALSVKRSQLRVAQPDRWHVRRGTADTSSHINADYSVLAAIALRSFNTQFVESFQIMLVDWRYGGSVFCGLNERTERGEQFRLIRHD